MWHVSGFSMHIQHSEALADYTYVARNIPAISRFILLTDNL